MLQEDEGSTQPLGKMRKSTHILCGKMRESTQSLGNRGEHPASREHEGSTQPLWEDEGKHTASVFFQLILLDKQLVWGGFGE